MNALIAELLSSGPVLTDGAWGTQMQARGLGIGEFPDFWNLTHPAQVLAVAQSYIDAGSRVILTNTFGANRIRLAQTEMTDRVADINREGARLSKQAAGRTAKVFASIGPGRKMLEPNAGMPELVGSETVYQTSAAQFASGITALINAGADFIGGCCGSTPEFVRIMNETVKKG